MRLKIFVFPLLLIILFFVGFNFIKPEYDEWSVKQDEIVSKRSELDSVQQTLSNIDALAGSLDSHSKEVAVVKEYLPTTQDQERVIDAINFIAVNSGVILHRVSFDAKSGVPATAPAVTKEAISTVDPVTGAVIDPALVAPTLPEPIRFSINLTFSGSYEGMRQFLGNIQRLDQLHLVTSFSIKKEEAKEGEGEGAASGVLQASLAADFFYLPVKTSQNAHLLDVFKGSSMDFSPVTRISDAEKYIPNLPEVSGLGRTNPFVR